MKAEENAARGMRAGAPPKRSKEETVEKPWRYGRAPQDPVGQLVLHVAEDRAAEARAAGAEALAIWLETLIVALHVEFKGPFLNYYHALAWAILGPVAGLESVYNLGDEAVLSKLFKNIIERRDAPPQEDQTGALLAFVRGVFVCEMGLVDPELAHRAARTFLLTTDGMDRDSFRMICMCGGWMSEETFEELMGVSPIVN